MGLMNEMICLLMPLLLCTIVQYFICEWYIQYGLIIPFLSLLIIVYKFYTSIVPTISFQEFHFQIILLHALMFTLYSSFFMVSSTIYLIKKAN